MRALLIILAISFCSCSSRPDYDDYLSKAGMKLMQSYTVLSHESESAIGDFSMHFKLKIGDTDYQTITNKFRQIENFKEVKENEIPDSFSSFGNTDKITSYRSGSTYHYEINKAVTGGKGIENLFIILTEDHVLDFTYAED